MYATLSHIRSPQRDVCIHEAAAKRPYCIFVWLRVTDCPFILRCAPARIALREAESPWKLFSLLCLRSDNV